MATYDERCAQYVSERSLALWGVATDALDAMHAACDASGKIGEALNERTLLAGSVALLRNLGTEDVYEGMKLKLALEWGPAMVTGGKISPETFIVTIKHRYPERLAGVPAMGMNGWAAFALYVKYGQPSHRVKATLKRDYPTITTERWAELAEACRDLRIVQDMRG